MSAIRLDGRFGRFRAACLEGGARLAAGSSEGCIEWTILEMASQR